MEMDMPTPCPTCSRIVELNDMNTCEICRKLYCDNCLEHNMDSCESCLGQEVAIQERDIK